MKPPPVPLIPSGLSPDCPDVLGQELFIECQDGWGWQRRINGTSKWDRDADVISSAELIVVPESYVEFTTSRSGLFGRVLTTVPGYRIERFLAYIMADGIDFDFTDHIAPAWRVMLGDGVPDYDSSWFPILGGNRVHLGYGVVSKSKAHLEAYELKRRQRNYQPPDWQRG